MSHSLHRRASLAFWLWPCYQLSCISPDDPVSLRMNMIENITEDHASISCTTCKGIASLPKGQSTPSWYQQCWQTEVALKTGINNYLHFKKFYVSVCSTLLLSFTYTAKLFKRKTLYCNFHCCSRPKDSVPTREIISKRNYIDLN